MSTSSHIRQRKSGFPSEWPYRPQDFERMDNSDDSDFYNTPRYVTHIDDRCIAHLSEYYGSVLRKPSTDPALQPLILDIASSWISHLPEDWSSANSHVVGIGMNKPELAKNRALTRYFVIDLNENPSGLSKELVSEKEKPYDAAICSVSIDYLVKPREMLADLSKCLKEGASVHLAFSNRCFPTKVVGRWLKIDEEERCDMVADYFHFAGTSDATESVKPGQLYENIEIVTILERSWTGDPLWVIRATKR